MNKYYFSFQSVYNLIIDILFLITVCWKCICNWGGSRCSSTLRDWKPASSTTTCYRAYDKPSTSCWCSHHARSSAALPTTSARTGCTGWVALTNKFSCGWIVCCTALLNFGQVSRCRVREISQSRGKVFGSWPSMTLDEGPKTTPKRNQIFTQLSEWREQLATLLVQKP